MAPEKYAIRVGEIRCADIRAIGKPGGEILVPIAYFGAVNCVWTTKRTDEAFNPRN